MVHNHGGKHWRRSGGQATRDKKWSHSHAHVEGEEVHVHNHDPVHGKKEELRRDIGPDRKNNPRDAKHPPPQARQALSPRVVSATVVELVGEHGATLTQYTVPTLPATVSDSELGIVTIPEASDSPIVVSPTSPGAPDTAPDAPPARTATESAAPPSKSSDSASNGVPAPTTDTAEPTVSIVPASSATPPTESAPIVTYSESIPASSAISEPVASSTAVPSAPTTESPASSIIVSTFPTVPLPSASVQPSSELSLVTLFPTTFIPIPSSSNPISVSVSVSGTPIFISASFWSSLTSTSLITSTIVLSSTSTFETSTSTVSFETSTTATSATSYDGGNGRWGPTEGGYPASPTDVADSPDHDSSDSATKPKIIGGVIGGVAGAALLLALLFFLLRLRKRRLVSNALGGSDRAMSETTFVAAAAAGASRLFDRFRTSKQDIASTAATGERGFQKLGGRKLQSVLETGGDGYDDAFGVQQENPFADPVPDSPAIGSSSAHPVVTAAGARQRQSRDIEQLGSSQRFPTPPLGRPESQSSDSSGQIVVRPSPAHTPITSSADLRTTMGVSATTGRAAQPGRAPTGPLPPVPVLRPTTGGTGAGSDAVGRTHPSANNSRASRFTEGF